jgi:hypothetical protein
MANSCTTVLLPNENRFTVCCREVDDEQGALLAEEDYCRCKH